LLTKCAKLKNALFVNQNHPYISSKSAQAVYLLKIKVETLYCKGFQLLATCSTADFCPTRFRVKPLRRGITAIFYSKKIEKKLLHKKTVYIC
jgi:hypothetical protein